MAYLMAAKSKQKSRESFLPCPENILWIGEFGNNFSFFKAGRRLTDQNEYLDYWKTFNISAVGVMF